MPKKKITPLDIEHLLTLGMKKEYSRECRSLLVSLKMLRETARVSSKEALERLDVFFNDFRFNDNKNNSDWFSG
jgi:hypothetical protein